MVHRLLGLAVVFVSLTGRLSPLAIYRAVPESARAVNRVEAEMQSLFIARAKQGQPIHFTAGSNIAATFDFRTNGGGTRLFEDKGPAFPKSFYPHYS